MSGLEAIRQAMRLLRAEPLRSILTLFGLVWGTAAVIFLMSWGDGLQRMLDDAFQRIGQNLVVAFPGRVSEDFSPAFDRRFLTYTSEDVANLRRRGREIVRVAGEAQRWVAGSYGARSISLDTRGLDATGFSIRSVRLAEGRTIRPSDVDHRRRIAVLGHRARKDLLGARGGVGSWIRLNGTPFRVVGVLERVGTQLMRDGDEIDDQAWIPLSTHQGLWPDRFGTEDDALPKLLIQARDRARMTETLAEIRAILAERLRVRPDDEEAVPLFSVFELLDGLPISQQNDMGVFIAAMTLAIGGIGILSMMLDSVRERRSEIGVRLAVGARRRDILLQFFVETLTISLLGGLLGVAIGVAGVKLLASDALRRAIPPAQADLVPVPELSFAVIATAVSVMVFVAVVAGLVPAWRAARVDPAETLRAD